MATEPKTRAERTPAKKQEPQQPEQQRNIVSPCCGAPITAFVQTQTVTWGSDFYVSGLGCNAHGCGNEWNSDGTALHWIEGE